MMITVHAGAAWSFGAGAMACQTLDNLAYITAATLRYFSVQLTSRGFWWVLDLGASMENRDTQSVH